jgi:hypothetical protein
MKKASAVKLAALLVLAALTLAACDLITPVSQSERLNKFVAALNQADRSSLYQNLDPAASYYTAAKISTFWDLLFPTDGTYSASGVSSSGSTTTATLRSTGSFGSQTVTFTMTATGVLNNNYLISRIALGGATVFQ